MTRLSSFVLSVTPILGLYAIILLPVTVVSADGAGFFVSQIPRILFDNIIFPAGDIDDTQCNIEDLERANDSQLHAIFQELQQTHFFRSFVVDLEQKCPLSQWTSGSSSSSSSSSSTSSVGHAPDNEEAEDEFECSGGGEEFGLDEDAEPLCTVDIGGGGAENFPFGGGAAAGSGGDPFGASVLQSLSEYGFSSQGQQATRGSSACGSASVGARSIRRMAFHGAVRSLPTA